MEITKIEQQKKRKDRYSVFVDGEYEFSLTDDQLLESGLSKGQEISQARLQQLKKDSEFGKAYSRALDYLSRRPRSEFELWRYLKKKEYGDQTIQKIIEKLLDKSYLDDAAFAKQWVEWRHGSPKHSRRKIRSELIEKRVDKELIDAALADISEEDERQSLRELIAKKQTQSRYQNRDKLVKYLMRRGYNYGLVKEELEEADSSQ